MVAFSVHVDIPVLTGAFQGKVGSIHSSYYPSLLAMQLVESCSFTVKGLLRYRHLDKESREEDQEHGELVYAALHS